MVETLTTLNVPLLSMIIVLVFLGRITYKLEGWYFFSIGWLFNLVYLFVFENLGTPDINVHLNILETSGITNIFFLLGVLAFREKKLKIPTKYGATFGIALLIYASSRLLKFYFEKSVYSDELLFEIFSIPHVVFSFCVLFYFALESRKKYSTSFNEATPRAKARGFGPLA